MFRILFKTSTLLIFVLILCNISCTVKKNNTALGIARDDQDVFRAANRYFSEEQYQRALLKYSAYIYSPYPDKKNLEEARYRLALTHFLMNQYGEAYVTAEELIEKNPDSKWADQASELIEKAKIQIARTQEQQDEKQQEIYQEIAKLENQIDPNEQNSERYMKLANLYWGIGNHQRAINYYEKAAKINPEVKENTQLKNRVRIAPGGEFTLREPMFELYADKAVKITQASLDPVTLRDDWLGEVDGVRYSGSVVNTGLYDVTNVQIEVSLYDTFNRVLDTKIEHVGTIRAGGKRPFSILFNLFNELHVNISKVETEVYYDTL